MARADLNDGIAIYLASRSPRRQALLQQIGIRFEVLAMSDDAEPALREEIAFGESPRDYVQRVARAKSDFGWRALERLERPRYPVLGADTEVVLDGRVLGKPVDAAAAASMLARLSGRSHDVLTAVTIRSQTLRESAVSVSQVSFRTLSADEISRYVATGEPFDKAGSYAIQGRAAAFVSRLEGSYSGVMGLPLHETAQILARMGIGAF